MTLKNQWKTLKENWLIGAVLLILFLLPSFSTLMFQTTSSSFGGYAEGSSAAVKMAGERASSSYYSSPDYPSPLAANFAPEVEDRKVTKTANLAMEVERGKFPEAEQQLKHIVKENKGFILNENSNRYGEGKRAYLAGSYTIKVEVQKYDAVVATLKLLGEAQSFSENAEDITGTFKSLETELKAERQRLQRYQKMLEEATVISDKLELTDRIFNQERTVAYLEDSWKNQGQQVEYATVYVQLNEERSEYVDVALVAFSELISLLVQSFNSLLKLLFWIVPYAIGAGVAWWVVRKVKKK